MASKHTAERKLERDFIDALRVCLGLTPLYATDASLSHRARWIARYGRQWEYIGMTVQRHGDSSID